MSKCVGTVANWLNRKGIGFITPEGMDSSRGTDILVHFSSLKQTTEDGFKSLEIGSKVEYEVESDPKDDTKKIAVNVTGVEGADCTVRVKGAGRSRAAKLPRAEKSKKESAEGSDDAEEGESKDDDDKEGAKKSKGKGKGRKGKGKGKGRKGKGKGAKKAESAGEESAEKSDE